VIIGRGGGGLDDKNILTTNVFKDFDPNLAIGEAADMRPAEGDVEVGGNRFGERPSSPTLRKSPIAHPAGS
jgi:hypothetical protein